MSNSRLFYALIVAVSLLGSCNKDDYENAPMEPNTDVPNAKSLFEFNPQNSDLSDFELIFQNRKSMVDQNSISVMNPLWHNIDMSSAVYTEYFGTPAVLANAYQSPFEYTLDMRNQILIKQLSSGEYEVTTLLYVPDSLYYVGKGFGPKLFNFTGQVLEYSDEEEVVATYTFYKGEVTGTETGTSALEPDPDCPNFGDGFLKDVKDWIEGIFRRRRRGGGSSGGSGSAGGSGDGGGSPGSVSGMGWGYGHHGGSGGGSEGGSSGGGPSNSPSCEDPAAFWAGYDVMVKRNYEDALSLVLTNFNIAACSDPYSTNEPCEITYTNILCQVSGSDCFESASSTNDFLACLTDILAPMNEPPVELPCQIAVEMFNITYGTNLSPFEVSVMLGGFGNLCGDQEAFNERVGEVLLLALLSENHFCESPSLADFQNDNDGTYLGLLREAIRNLRIAGVDWYADMVEELIECNEFQTVGDLRDTWYMVKDFISEYNNSVTCQREQEQTEWMMAIFSPSNVGQILGFTVFNTNFSLAYSARFRVIFATTAARRCADLSREYNTFNQFKSVYGNAGSNKAWHHIVEQGQISRSGFDPRKIHHPENLIQIESGFSGSWHGRINGAYAQNGRYIECGGQSLRDWLVGKPFEVHYEWGLKVMRELRP